MYHQVMQSGVVMETLVLVLIYNMSNLETITWLGDCSPACYLLQATAYFEADSHYFRCTTILNVLAS